MKSKIEVSGETTHDSHSDPDGYRDVIRNSELLNFVS